MIDLSTGTVARVSAPPLAPIDRPIDLEHLSRMTLGERSLEREVLQLFDRQAGMLLARMKNSMAPAAGALAHTLKGSARGIGAWNVAKWAESVELAAGTQDTETLARAIDQLSGAVAEAKIVIGDLLRSH
jgi:HPt (histidine-containing phosphotransfer) domain-containing protein